MTQAVCDDFCVSKDGAVTPVQMADGEGAHAGKHCHGENTVFVDLEGDPCEINEITVSHLALTYTKCNSEQLAHFNQKEHQTEFETFKKSKHVSAELVDEILDGAVHHGCNFAEAHEAHEAHEAGGCTDVCVSMDGKTVKGVQSAHGKHKHPHCHDNMLLVDFKENACDLEGITVNFGEHLGHAICEDFSHWTEEGRKKFEDLKIGGTADQVVNLLKELDHAAKHHGCNLTAAHGHGHGVHHSAALLEAAKMDGKADTKGEAAAEEEEQCAKTGAEATP